MQKTVLIVEDEKTMREVLIEALTHAGFEIFQAENGAQGLSTALSSQPDLIITDITLPQMSGFQMMVKIRESNE